MRTARDRFKNYSSQLETLSLEALDRSAQKLVRVENDNVAKLIAHLAEMASRKTALEMGYSSLYDYCIRRLNLSEGAVPARIHVANVCRRFPQLLGALADGRVSLTVASLLAPHLTDRNADSLISDCVGKTRKQTEEYLVALRPKAAFEPSIRRRPVPAPPPARVVLPIQPEMPRPSRPIVQPATTDTFNFRFSAGRDFKAKFDRLAQVFGVEQAQNHMAVIMEKALDIALDKSDPARKLHRRRKRSETRKTPSRSNEIPNPDARATSRYIPAALSERVHHRAAYRCEFRAPDGKRCSARTGLQIDHIKPFAIHREHEEQFLRLLCPAHNRLTAEHVYGTAFIERKIYDRRNQRAP